MRRIIMAAALAASCLLLLGREVVAADDQASDGKLPEPALRFAKDASLRVAEIEREWQKLSDGVGKARADFVLQERRHTEASLREEATRLLGAAKKLLDDQKRIAPETERFKDALKKAASHYRAVSVLYKSFAEKAKAGEVREDYLQLVKVYEAKADAVAERARKLTTPTGLKTAGEVIEEGNVFIERLLETLSVGPVADADCQVFATRLRKHGERCQLLSAGLSQAIEKVLGAKATISGLTTSPEKNDYVSAATKELAPLPPKGVLESEAILDTSWTSLLTIRGVECRQVLRFQKDGTCIQSVYRQGTNGLGALVGTRSYTFKLHPGGRLSVYAGGLLIEWGKITVLSRDRLVYDIAENIGDPTRSGFRITFVRHDGR